MSSTQENEIEITITSEQLGDDSYVKCMLVETKLKVLKEISDASGCDFNTKVLDLCPEVAAWPELISKYNITITKASIKPVSKPKIVRKKKKSVKKTVVPVTEEPSSPASEEASSTVEVVPTPTVVSATEDPSSPASVEASSPASEEASSPASEEASVTKKTSIKTKKKKKKIVSRPKKST